jgi:glyoxylase-like metal-dependent hydrolase (beta-lactamase superfamily II)
VSGEATRLSERVRVVLAPNPSPMTLEGTNTYLVGDERNVIVIDPGPDDEGHLDRVRASIGDAVVVAVFLTHWHVDHSESAEELARGVEAVVGSSRTPETGSDLPIRDGERAGGAGIFLRALHTPGHSSDHLCYLLEEERALFTGDHILGRGTTVIAHPDGDMAAYMASLERLRGLDLDRMYPGHGPVIEDPQAVLIEHVEHRKMRERHVIEALPGTPEELVARIYVDVDPVLHPVAALSVRAHLAKLASEGIATEAGGVWRRLG